MSNKFTQWQHFKENYLWVSLFFILGGGWMLYDIEPEHKWFSIFPLFVGLIMLPIGSYVSYNKKFK